MNSTPHACCLMPGTIGLFLAHAKPQLEAQKGRPENFENKSLPTTGSFSDCSAGSASCDHKGPAEVTMPKVPIKPPLSFTLVSIIATASMIHPPVRSQLRSQVLSMLIDDGNYHLKFSQGFATNSIYVIPTYGQNLNKLLITAREL